MDFKSLRKHIEPPNELLMLLGTAHDPEELTRVANCMKRRQECAKEEIFDYFNFDKIGREKITVNH